jgi:MtN3 and saliva related transmembrane protein
MIYVYDRIDPGCEKSVQAVGELMRSGLAVVAGKLEKELQWFAMSAKNLKGQPIAPHLAEMERDVRDTASAFRSFAAEFAKPIAAEPVGSRNADKGNSRSFPGPRRPGNLFLLRLFPPDPPPGRAPPMSSLDPFFSDLSGYAAGILTTAAFLPQVIKTYRTRSVRDISLAMYLIFTCGILLWLLHGLAVGSGPVVAANSVGLLLSGSMVAMKLAFGAGRDQR